MLHLHALVLHASPDSAEPGLPHRGKPVATAYRPGEHLHAGRTYKRGVPTADERVAVPGMHRRTPTRRFSWDALSVTNATECGWRKCFFPTQREDEGWLVGQCQTLSKPHRDQCRDAAGFLGPRNQIPEMAPSTNYFPQYSRAWARAEELRADFGVDHLLRGPPFLATLSHEQATYLNAKIQARLDRQKHPKWHYPYRSILRHGYNITLVRYYAAGPHPVQAVRACSWPECVVLRCTSPLTDQAVDGFVANVPNKTKLSLGIKQNFALVATMVKARPCLKSDFQVYLRNDGTVLNIDLDRCEIPVGDEEKLRLAQFPGLCGRHSSQLTLDKALEQLTGVSSLPVAPPQRTEPAKVARPSRKATNSSSLRGGQTEDARLKKGGPPAPRARVGASSTDPLQ